MKSHHAALEAFGLSEKEAAVYAAALELGRATADQLSKQANIKRSTTYVQIESLQKVGLMSSFEEGKKTFFAPESPQNLERLLERQQKELELKQSDLKKSLPDLTHLFEGAGERPVVRFYQGKEGIMTMREEMLAAKEKQLLVMFSADSLNAVFSVEERDVFSKKRAERGIKLRALYTQDAGPFKTSTNPLSELRFVSNNLFSIKTDIVIFDNSLAISSLKGSLFGVVITSEQISQSMRAVFETIWSVTK